MKHLAVSIVNDEIYIRLIEPEEPKLKENERILYDCLFDCE
jgi:hypothetical protein